MHNFSPQYSAPRDVITVPQPALSSVPAPIRRRFLEAFLGVVVSMEDTRPAGYCVWKYTKKAIVKCVNIWYDNNEREAILLCIN